MQIEDNLKSSYCKTIIRSIMCRCRFGGMGGDMWMLRQYAYIWYTRFLTDQINSDDNNDGTYAITSISSFFLKSANVKNDFSKGFPKWLHLIENLRDKDRSCTFIQKNYDLRKLQIRLIDVPLAGVDFHCIPKMIQETCRYYRLRTAKNNNIAMDVGITKIDNINKNNISHDKLESIIQNSIWKFSSSVNYKLSLYSGTTLTSGTKEERLKLLGIYKVCQRFIIKYQQNYLKKCF
jgi:hypothetical protein